MTVSGTPLESMTVSGTPRESVTVSGTPFESVKVNGTLLESVTVSDFFSNRTSLSIDISLNNCTAESVLKPDFHVCVLSLIHI